MSSDMVCENNGAACPIYPEVVLIGKYWNSRFDLSKDSETLTDRYPDDRDNSREYNYREIDRVHGEQAFAEFIRSHPYLHARSVEEQIGWFVLTGVPQQTDWFRDRNVVRVLRYHLLPLLLQSARVRIASVGCSFGMEVYSYLLSLWEYRDSIELHGFDINPYGLQVAAKGIFPGRKPVRNLIIDYLPVSFQDEALVTRSVLAEAIESVRMVDRTAGRDVWFQFGQQARSQVRFAVHDILDAPLSERFEVISLLKVLLHYPRDSRLAILANIGASLVEGGWLLIDSEYAGDFFEKGMYDNEVKNELRDSGFIPMPAYAPSWWGGQEDLTRKVMLWRRQ